MTITPTHQSTCLDDGLVIPLIRSMDLCTNDDPGHPTHDDPRWLPLAESVAEPICEDCMLELDWTLPRPIEEGTI